LALLDGIDHQVVESTTSRRYGNVVLVWDRPQTSESALKGYQTLQYAMETKTYMETINAASASETCQAIKNFILRGVRSLRGFAPQPSGVKMTPSHGVPVLELVRL